MIGKTTLKKFEFETIQDYFSYIVDSEINGNYEQVKELFKKLSDEQKKDFFNYLKDNEIKFNYSRVF